MARMFGTDGVRGVAGTELTIELAMKLGQAGAYVLTKEQSHLPTIIIGCDTEQMLFLWELPRHLQLHILQGNIK